MVKPYFHLTNQKNIQGTIQKTNPYEMKQTKMTVKTVQTFSFGLSCTRCGHQLRSCKLMTSTRSSKSYNLRVTNPTSNYPYQIPSGIQSCNFLHKTVPQNYHLHSMYNLLKISHISYISNLNLRRHCELTSQYSDISISR